MSFRYYPFNRSKKSAVSKTSEREFERELRKLEQLEENTKKIHKDMQKCIESQAAESKCESQILLSLQASALYRDDEKLRDVVDHWMTSAKKLELLVEELNATSQKAIVEPMRKFSTIFPSVQQAVRKREQSLQEYSKCQEKVDKYLKRDRTGPNVVKLDSSRKACANARSDFETQNTALMEEIPSLYEGRITYFKPSLEALVKAQVKYYTDSEETFGQLCRQLDVGSSPSSQSSAELKQSIQQKLAEIRALSITVDDQQTK